MTQFFLVNIITLQCFYLEAHIYLQYLVICICFLKNQTIIYRNDEDEEQCFKEKNKQIYIH